jgi:S-adenosylmethionine-diacylglycerol 3-amino-3-carboxypropyl transferase
LSAPRVTAMADDLLADPRIHYSQCWEDVAVARAALRVPSGGRVLAIGAAGDNVLALLLDDPGSILALDNNPAQTALLELKRAAFRRLPVGRIAGFLGSGADQVRLGGYEDIRAALSADAATFWDGHREDILHGVIHAGRFERYLGAFRRWVLPLAPGRPAVRAMLAATDVDEQAEIFRERWDTPRWRALARVFFSRRLLAAFGRHPAAFEQAPAGDVGRHFLERARIGLTATPICRNPFATYILTGGFRGPDAVPDYLRPDAHASIAGRADRIEARTQSLIDALAGLPDRSIDAFYLSDVFELFSTEEYEQALGEIARTGRHHARLCYWNNLVDRHRPAELAGDLDSHDELARELHRRDRAFLYSRCIVESVRPRRGRLAPAARRATEDRHLVAVGMGIGNAG